MVSGVFSPNGSTTAFNLKEPFMAVPTWIKDVQGVGAVVAAINTFGIAVVGAIIALRQAHTAEQKLRLDLFHLRYKVYEIVLKAIVTALNRRYEDTFDDGTLVLQDRKEEARFLFDADVYKFLNEVETTILRYRYGILTMKHEGFQSNPSYGDFVQTVTQDGKLLLRYRSEVGDRLAPFLLIKERTAFNREYLASWKPTRAETDLNS